MLASGLLSFFEWLICCIRFTGVKPFKVMLPQKKFEEKMTYLRKKNYIPYKFVRFAYFIHSADYENFIIIADILLYLIDSIYD